MVTTYVLDTSVLLASPKAVLRFAEHDVVVPLVAIKELESKRTDPIIGYQARTALRTLEQLSHDGGADLKSGVPVPGGGTVRIEINHISVSMLPDTLQNDRTHDTRVLAVAKNLDHTLDGPVVLVSRDLPMRLLATSVEVTAEDYRNDQTVVDEAFTGIQHVDVDDGIVDALFDGETFTTADVGVRAVANEGLILNSPAVSSSALTVVDPDQKIRLVRPATSVFGLTGRSAEQRIGLHHLLNPNLPVVSLGGPAGTGKTIMALAAGLEQIMERNMYHKMVVFRSLHAVGGENLGYLPGTEAEKMDPWTAAISDALESLGGANVADEITDRGLLTILPITHIRGRTLGPKTWVIVDECQNLEFETLLAVLSRAGEGTKMVLSWDATQRDNLRVGRYDGITSVVERLKGEPLFAHTTLVKTERSAVAEMVTRILGG